MKRGIVGLCFFMFLVFWISFSSASLCTDSDNKNYSKLGTTTLDDEVDEPYYFYDLCLLNGAQVNECSGTNCFMQEFYCNGGNQAEIKITCSNGCKQGACVQTSSVVPAPVGGDTCTETDNGKNYTVGGKTTLDIVDEPILDYWDYCFREGVGEANNCTGESCHVIEYYCQGNEVLQITEKCLNGCKDRACIASSVPAPTPTPVQAKKCSDFGYVFGTVGNSCNAQNTAYDLSGCYNITNSCTDYDKGADYYNSSLVSSLVSTTSGLGCGGTSGSGSGSAGQMLDKCTGDILTEAICKADNTSETVSYTCPNGCENGACILGTESCIDTDALIETKEISKEGVGIIAGLDIKVEDISITASGFGAKINASKDGSSSEFILTSTDRNGTEKIELNGAKYTIQLISTSETSSKIKVISYANYFTKGKIITKDESVEDSCIDSNKLKEGACDEAGGNTYEYSCPNGCVDGSCVAAPTPPGPSPTPPCIPKYSCKIKPLKCPDTGIQIKECKDLACDTSPTEEEITCTPNECTGCESEGKCVPYGYRTVLKEEGKSSPSYCDIEGSFKKQRTEDDTGNWAECQNNYECKSNLCSNGQCVETGDIKGIKSLFVRVVCRLAHIFNQDNYNICVGDYLGYSPALDEWVE